MKTVTVAVACLIGLTQAAAAQERLAVTAGFGPVNGTRGDGVHGSATVEYQTPWRPLQIRVEGIAQKAHFVDILSFGSAQLRPIRGPLLEPYGFLGVGAFFDNGPQTAAVVGAGADISIRGIPVFIEYKHVNAREGFRLISIGLRLKK
jgi:hypothetical protein